MSGTSASSWWSDAAVEGNIWNVASRPDAPETEQWSRGGAMHTQHLVANDLAEQPRLSTALCKFYASGGCTRGDSCPFRHDLTVSATTDTDASRGFVLTGQVVNLNTSASANKADVAVSSTSLSKRHVMNPEAAPFVSVDTNESLPTTEGIPEHAAVMHQAAAQENYGAMYGVSPGTYRKNARNQPPLTTHSASYKHSYGYDDSVGGAYQEDDYYSGDHDVYPGADYPSYQPQWSQEDGFAGEHDPYHQRAPQEPKWTPAGVFSTTSDNAAVRQAMAGYYESQQAVGPSSDAWYQHRRMQAMRSPLSSKGHRATSNAYGATTSSNSSAVGGDEDYDADVAGYTYASGYSHNTSRGAYPHNNYAVANGGHRAQQPVQQFHPYGHPQRESTSRTSAEMHRKLRNRVEA